MAELILNEKASFALDTRWPINVCFLYNYIKFNTIRHYSIKRYGSLINRKPMLKAIKYRK